MNHMDRVWARVERRGADECWPWPGSSQGVPQLWTLGPHAGRRQLRVSRLILEDKLGRALEPGEVARHTCDNHRCCNPAHIIEGTQADNMNDMRVRRRHAAHVDPEGFGRRVTEGQRERWATMTPEERDEIMRKVRAGL